MTNKKYERNVRVRFHAHIFAYFMSWLFLLRYFISNNMQKVLFQKYYGMFRCQVIMTHPFTINFEKDLIKNLIAKIVNIHHLQGNFLMYVLQSPNSNMQMHISRS